MTNQQREAERLYLQGKKYKEIAERLDVNVNTVKSWKSRLGWEREKVATDTQPTQPRKRGGQPNNKNSIRNKGGTGAPKNNGHAVKHGMFRQYMPDDEETLGIYDSAQESDGASMLYEMILIKFTNIIRAQKIMFVRDIDDLTQTIKKQKDADDYSEIEYEIQQAWDKQANALTAQARAMSALQSMIKQFVEMTDEDDLRRLKVEKLQQDMHVQREELDIKKKDMEQRHAPPEQPDVSAYIDAMKGEVSEVFADDDDIDEERE